MKHSIHAAALIALALAAPLVSAQDKAMPAKTGMGMGMGMDMEKEMAPMQENMKKMQMQMEKIGTITDPKERQKLLDEHMQTMQENMKSMRGMGGAMMKGGMSKGGMPMSAPKAAETSPSDVASRQQAMEKRMDMMQMTLEQLVNRDQAEKPMPHM